MRRDDLHQQPPLVVSFANEADVAEPEVSEAAVDELRGSTRGARAKVAAVDERDGEACARRLGCDSRPDDPASDHEQVVRPLAELPARFLTRD
jgi:hypothetical protein